LFNYWWEQWEWKREESQPRKAIKNFIIFSAIFFGSSKAQQQQHKNYATRTKKREMREKIACIVNSFPSSWGEREEKWNADERWMKKTKVLFHAYQSIKELNWEVTTMRWKKAFQLSCCRVKFLSHSLNCSFMQFAISERLQLAQKCTKPLCY
jgi:hypothetical protein